MSSIDTYFFIQSLILSTYTTSSLTISHHRWPHEGSGVMQRGRWEVERWYFAFEGLRGCTSLPCCKKPQLRGRNWEYDKVEGSEFESVWGTPRLCPSTTPQSDFWTQKKPLILIRCFLVCSTPPMKVCVLSLAQTTNIYQ